MQKPIDPYKDLHLEMVPDRKPGFGRRRGETPAPFGYCPQCGAAGIKRSKSRLGDDWCVNNHAYPSDHAFPHPPGPEVGYPLVGSRK